MNSILLLLCYLAVFLGFWLPGSVLARSLGRRFDLPPALIDVLGLALAATAGYAAFWARLIHPVCGMAFSAAYVGGGAIAAIGRSVAGRERLAEHFSVPVRVTFLLGWLYLCGVGLFGGVESVPAWFLPNAGEDVPSSLFSLQPRSIDSLIPVKFAHAVANRTPLRGDIQFGDWQFSDRPPLQTGVLLLFWPLTACFKYGILGQAVGTMLQVQCVLGVLSLAWALGWSRTRTAFVVFAICTTGFVYFSCVYVWPKMLAAALFMGAVAPLLWALRQQRVPRTVEAILAGGAAALSLLSHGSSAFSLLPLALMALVCRRLVKLRVVVPGALIALLLYAPWTAYQKYVDPPGDRCVKWMLTAKSEPDPRPWPEVVRSVYGSTTFQAWCSARWENLCLLFRDEHLDHDIVECARGIVCPRADPPDAPSRFTPRYYVPSQEIHYTLDSLAALLRYDQVEQTFRALGLFNLAWPLLVWQLIRTRGRARRRRGRSLLLWFSFISLLLWWLLIFGGGALLIRTASHAMLLALLMLAATIVYDAPLPFRRVLMGLHLAFSFWLWAWMAPSSFAVARFSMAQRPMWVPLLTGMAAALGIIYYTITSQVSYTVVRGSQAESDQFQTPALRLGLLACVASGAFMLVVTIAIARHSLRKDGMDLITFSSVTNPTALFDGITTDRNSYATVAFSDPMQMRFKAPRRLREIRLHLYDYDDQFYRFTVDVQSAGEWTPLADYSRNDTRGLIVMPCPETPLEAVRLTGLYNSDERFNPSNKAIHLKEVELIPR